MQLFSVFIATVVVFDHMIILEYGGSKPNQHGSSSSVYAKFKLHRGNAIVLNEQKKQKNMNLHFTFRQIQFDQRLLHFGL